MNIFVSKVFYIYIQISSFMCVCVSAQAQNNMTLRWHTPTFGSKNNISTCFETYGILSSSFLLILLYSSSFQFMFLLIPVHFSSFLFKSFIPLHSCSFAFSFLLIFTLIPLYFFSFLFIPFNSSQRLFIPLHSSSCIFISPSFLFVYCFSSSFPLLCSSVV